MTTEKKEEKKEEKKAEAAPAVVVPEPPHVVAINEIKTAMAQLERAVSSKEERFVTRALRHITRIRRKLSVRVLNRALDLYFLPDSPVRAQLAALIAKAPETEMDTTEDASTSTNPPPAAAAATAAPAAAPPAAATAATVPAAADAALVVPATPVPEEKITKPSSPEVEVYLWLLVTIFLLDQKLYEEAIESSNALLDQIALHNRRSLDQFSAKVYFYYSRASELVDRLPEIRSKLLAAHRSACLRHDHTGQAVLLNLLLRNYLSFNLFEQADALVRKTTFPEEYASNNQHARFLYYTGRIKAVQLDYTDSCRCLRQAIRKAPTATGLGFRLAVHKLSCIVQLLMGEIPDRVTFFQKGMVQQLAPYLQLTQAVRIGNLDKFKSVMHEHAKQFQLDKTYTLIVRLRHNVIKTGLRKIHLTYSTISLKDVCAKLQLDAVEDAEFIVAKAIHDGVIDATIDHTAGTVISKGSFDNYSTDEPQAQFHKRISFCLDMHNQAVKAMRFPPNTHKRINETDAERAARKQEEADLANDIDDDY